MIWFGLVEHLSKELVLGAERESQGHRGERIKMEKEPRDKTEAEELD